MNLLLPINILPPSRLLSITDRILLAGSCFTEHISRYLQESGFRVRQNPHGILFNPLSLSNSLRECAEERSYTPSDLFFLNEYWHSWNHHGDFSFRDPDKCLAAINESIATTAAFLREADVLILTLGSAFAYYHLKGEHYVSNNHRAPDAEFRKDLLSVETMHAHLQYTLDLLRQQNPNLQVIATVSPVRHIRDGVVDNNRSKARLLELVHSLKGIWYFPAYELVVDVLRDYRFYDADLVHPNYAATTYVWEQFSEHAIEPGCWPLMKQVEQLHRAARHRPRDPESLAHKAFLATHAELVKNLQREHPFVGLEGLLRVFEGK